jgi:alpha-glucoside transport system substrate-binding protein
MRHTLYASVALAALVAGGASAQDLVFPPGEGDFSWDSYNAWAESAPDLSGQTVTITGPWLQPEDGFFRSVTDYFAAATGAEVIYTGSDSFEQQIVIDAEAGAAPNIAVFPQPGLAADMASRGLLYPMPEGMDEWVRENYGAGESWVNLATFPGQGGADQFFGIFYNVNLKSLVWYVPENFEDAGYEVPTTMEELKALTEQIVADGEVPWCIGLGSGAATGWPATDWVEDLMLRMHPPEVYDQWTTNEMPFNDPRVVEAIEEFGWFIRNDSFVVGGAAAAATTDFRDSPRGLFEFPPQCYMHRQASFIPNFFPEDAEMGVDVDFFYFPAYASKDLGTPLLGSGSMTAIINDRPVARAFIEFLKTPIAHEVFMAQGQWYTAHKGVNPDANADETQRALSEILTSATTFRFDASDLMPGEIGTSAFWTGMIDYTTGTSAEDVASAIQRRWDALR